jgi:hypothetical protein
VTGQIAFADAVGRCAWVGAAGVSLIVLALEGAADAVAVACGGLLGACVVLFLDALIRFLRSEA